MAIPPCPTDIASVAANNRLALSSSEGASRLDRTRIAASVPSFGATSKVRTSRSEKATYFCTGPKAATRRLLGHLRVGQGATILLFFAQLLLPLLRPRSTSLPQLVHTFSQLCSLSPRTPLSGALSDSSVIWEYGVYTTMVRLL
jgi:hypothetical protein